MLSLASFSEAMAKAFPQACHDMAQASAELLVPFVDVKYYTNFQEHYIEAISGGETMRIPGRLRFLPEMLENRFEEAAPLAAQCLFTRSNDGYLRHRALKRLLAQSAPWTVPYIILPCGSYVVEITDDILAATPDFDQTIYAPFIRENRPLMRLLRAQATSYWNVYYRHRYPFQKQYPGLSVITALEHWAT